MKKILRNHTLIKTFCWRLIALTTTAILAYAITGEIELAAKISVWESVVKMTLYYFHEKFWEKKNVSS